MPEESHTSPGPGDASAERIGGGESDRFDASARRQRELRKRGAALTREFARVEGQTATVLRRIAEQTRNPETAARRRRLAGEADRESARALERANLLDPARAADIA